MTSLPPDDPRQKLTAWLHYYQDLRLGPFYNDRRSVHGAPLGVSAVIVARVVRRYATNRIAHRISRRSSRAAPEATSVRAASSASSRRRHRRGKARRPPSRPPRSPFYQRRRFSTPPSASKATRSSASAKISANARAAACTKRATKLFTASAIRKLRCSSSAKAPATTKIFKASPSSAAPENCSRK
jgi:hypothetical protein